MGNMLDFLRILPLNVYHMPLRLEADANTNY